MEQFNQNRKYYPAIDNAPLDDDINLMLEMTLYKKQIQATYYQQGDGDYTRRVVWFMIAESPISSYYQIVIYYENRNNMVNGEDL